MNSRKALTNFLANRGFRVSRVGSKGSIPSDMDAESSAIIRECAPYSMQSPERLFAVVQATRYVNRHRIPGAIVECGVWRGGGMMAVAKSLIEVGDVDRHLFLFDTYEGMSEPTDADKDASGTLAKDRLAAAGPASSTSWVWAYASEDDVRSNLSATQYPPERLHFVRGRVEDTIPQDAPDEIAILRLDTDWYESTKHELQHLVSRVSPGGVLLIDDYGHWQGARKAVDEWLAASERPVLLHRTDSTGRAAVLN